MDYTSLAYGESDDIKSRNKKSESLPDFHLRNPLKPLHWPFNSSYVPARQREDRAYYNNYTNNAICGKPTELILNSYDVAPDMKTELWSEVIGDVRMRALIDMSLFPEHCRFNVESVIESFKCIDINLWNAMRFWSLVLTLMNALSSKREIPSGYIKTKGMIRLKGRGGSIVHVCNSSVMIQTETEKIYDGDWVRMASDLFTQRFLLVVSAKIGGEINPYMYPSIDLLYSVFAWGDNVLQDLDNEGYKVIKTYEAILVGIMQCKGESGVVDNNKFLNNTLKDLANDDIKYWRHAITLTELFSNISNMHHITQCYGLHRVWGHPIVDGQKGMEKVRVIGQKDIVKDSTLSRDAGRMFKKLYCREFKKKHGVYPEILSGSTLLHTKLDEGDHTATDNRSHILEDWDRVVFRKQYDLPETFNLSMIVADKSISPTRSELAKIIREKRTVMDAEKRRGVRRWLSDTTLNPKDFLSSINEGKFPEDHKIIGLTPKERELNPTPRMFALMSHLMRVYVVVTEQMLSDHILPMFPQITMTDTLLDLTKKMYSTVKHQSSRNMKKNKKGNWASRVVCMSLDFEKWNGHMRKEMTSGVFTSIGNLFGLSELYNMTYDIFEGSYYYLADGSYLPAVDRAGNLIVDNPKSFAGHKGGMEGLRQKGWTIYTVCCLEVILSKYDCTYKIMGMGDNQVLQITLYTNYVDHRCNPTEAGIQEMRNILGTIFKDLVHSFTAAGLPLKPLETWMSEDLYLYGKIPLWRGVPLAMDLKKLMRTFPWSNADIMTLENALGTISGNALSATQSSSCVWVAYIVNLIMSDICIADFMSYHPLLGKSLWKSGRELDKWVLAMSSKDKKHFEMPEHLLRRRTYRILIQIIPRTLAGYNGVNIHEFMMRGFPDNLSRDLSYLMLVSNSHQTPSWLADVIEAWISPIYMPEMNYTTLIQDVTAVNLMSPRAPTSGIKQTVTQYMTEDVTITNPEFKDLMKSKFKEHEDYFSECLCEGEILHIRLLHDVYDATIYGYVNSILSKVVKTSTIQNLAIGSSTRDVFSVIYRDEVNYFNYFIWRCHKKGQIIQTRCATERCKIMRLEGWQKELKGVTTPYPASYLIETRCHENGLCSCDDGYLSVHYPDGQITDDAWINDIGGNPPYLGSTTKEKVVIGTGGRIYSGEPLVRRPISLLRTINWFVPQDSNMANLITELVRSVTNLNPTPYIGISEGTAGSEIHRYRDASTSHGALTSSNFLYSTRIHLSTDHLTRYSKGSENTDIHYQSVFAYMTERSNMYISRCLKNGLTVDRFRHYRQTCYKCINPISEDFNDLMSTKALSTIPSRKNNPYLFVDQSRIRISEDYSPFMILKEISIDKATYDNMMGQLKLKWLQDVIVDRIISDIIGTGSSETSVSTGLLDVKSYERTMYLKLDPKYMIKKVMSRLTLVAEWSNLTHSSGLHKLSEENVCRSLINILSSAETHSFLGLGMFYCWEETAMRMNIYAEMTTPTTNPVSIDSSCDAIKRNLISLSFRQSWKQSDRIGILSEDEKRNFLIRKLELYKYLRTTTKCSSCLTTCSMMRVSDIRYIKTLSCKESHKLFDRMKTLPWKISNVTVERLRKDCESAPRLETYIPHLVNPATGKYCVRLLNGRVKTSRANCAYDQDQPTLDTIPTNHFRYSPYNLLCVQSLPTSTRYKYLDILSLFKNEIIGNKVFCVGDGLGSTSALLSELGAREVISSTLLQPDEAIPQTYVHNHSPMSIYANENTINLRLMIDRCNDVSSTKWIEDWTPVIENCSMLVSDIEVIGPEGSSKRTTILENLLRVKRWDIAIIKDYIYSVNDIANRLRRINSSTPGDWMLITSKFRSNRYPEVWWVLKKSENITRLGLGPDVRNMRELWNSIRVSLLDRYQDDIITRYDIELIRMMHRSNYYPNMLSYLRQWMSYPVIGTLLPNKGSFTKVFFYLKKTKRPEYVKVQKSSSDLRLYNSDYLYLRERVFAMAVSMLADINQRCCLMKDSTHWDIDWEEHKTNDWRLYLFRSDEGNLPECNVLDYIPIMNIVMREERLLYKTYDNTIKFGKRKGRETLTFPISNVAYLGADAHKPSVKHSRNSPHAHNTRT